MKAIAGQPARRTRGARRRRLLAPQWLVFMTTLVLAKGVVVLGLVLLMRTGLVSFGQGLYFGLGAYAAALLSHHFRIADAAAMLLAGARRGRRGRGAARPAARHYREIFFAMLSLAFSMILYGLLVKSAALGSTDGFNLQARTFPAWRSRRESSGASSSPPGRSASWSRRSLVHRLLGGHWGRLSTAVRDNELRVAYLGASVYRVVYVNYLIAGALAGLGGALVALAVGHVDPETAYWTTSGEFVFIAILGGTQSIAAPFLAAAIFEALRTVASQYAPNVWQMSLGLAHAGHHHVPARRPVVAGAAPEGRMSAARGARAAQELRRRHRGGRHQPVVRRRHGREPDRRQRRRQDHLPQHGHRLSQARQRPHHFRGPRHRRAESAPDHATRHLRARSRSRSCSRRSACTTTC